MTMTKRIGIPLVMAALGAMAFIALQPAEAAGFNERVSGNFIDTAIDTNGDGAQANYFSGATAGRNGATYEGLVEVDFSDPAAACDDGIMPGDIVAYSIVRRYSTGDLLYSQLVDGYVCFNTATGMADFVVHAELRGGTGRFVNATGTYTASFTIQLLIPDPLGGIGHGAFYGTTSG